MIRMANRDEWDLSRLPDPDRRKRLLDAPPPRDLLARLLEEAAQAAGSCRVQLYWQEADEAPGHSRLVAAVPVSAFTFDLLFNGRSGYRAQYYLSPEEGVLYNKQILDGFLPVVRTAYERSKIQVSFRLIECSLRAPHAKIWVFEERQAFNDALEETLNPLRWVENGAKLGRRVPLPSHSTIDLKGAFVSPDMENLYVDPLKLERPCDLHLRGYT